MKKTTFCLAVTCIFLLSGCKTSEPSKYDAFASCITEKGAIMYGTEWCPHCKSQKEMFGPSFEKVDYVDCDRSRISCEQAGVTGYPTWVISGGEKLIGTQELTTLSQKTACELPAAS